MKTKLPADREFFFNLLNTLKPGSIEEIVYNSIKQRQNRSKIENEIEVTNEFRSIFTDEFSLIGNRGNCIKTLRIGHKHKPRVYKERKKYKIEFSEEITPYK